METARLNVALMMLDDARHLLGAAPLQRVLGAISRLTVDTPQLQVLPLYRVATFGNEPIDVFLS